MKTIDVEFTYHNNAVCVRQYLVEHPTHRLTFCEKTGKLVSLEELLIQAPMDFYVDDKKVGFFNEY